MIKPYSKHLFKLLLALLAMSAVIMCTLAYRASVQEQQHNAASLSRSAEATAREIELYVGGLQRMLRVFAQEQRALLVDVIANPHKLPVLREKISLYFPEHLAFAVSDPNVISTLISKPELFGESCRANLNFHSRNEMDLAPVLSLHSSVNGGDQHFDVMASIRSPEAADHSMGIVIVSFRVNDLLRLLALGSSSTHTLFLETKPTEVVKVINRYLAPEVSESPSENLSAAVANYSLPIQGTPWQLHGLINTSESSSVPTISWIQTALGLIALLIAGFAAWWSIEQEKISRNRTKIVLRSVDKERKRIARELHDQVLADVSHSKRLLMDLVPEYAEADKSKSQRLQAIQTNVDNLSHHIRTSINDLYPHILDNLGLCSALESLTESCRQLDIKCHTNLDINVDRMLDPEQKLHVYRIAAELLNNALEHSDCTEISLALEHKNSQVIMCFDDNGKGFDYLSKSKELGLGLNNIDFRVSVLGGRSRWVDNAFELILFREKYDD